MKAKWALFSLLAAAVAAGCFAQQPGGDQQPGNPAGHGRGMGKGQGIGMGQGITGTVTEAAADHFTVKTFEGETYTVHFSANTRIMKQAPMPADAQNQGGGQRSYMRTPPTPINASDIKVGDAIMARGEMDDAAKSVGAMAIVELDPSIVQRLRTMEESFGKTWMAGRITAIDGTKVTIEGGPNHGSYTFVADDNTEFRSRREPITLADLKVGAAVRVEGSVKDGQFVAKTVNLMMVRAMGGPAPREGPPPQ